MYTFRFVITFHHAYRNSYKLSGMCGPLSLIGEYISRDDENCRQVTDSETNGVIKLDYGHQSGGAVAGKVQ
mgnify:CR=1 FL=1